jgi:DNA polymerase III delta subunit
MNFNQWRNYAVKGEVSRITYCCGDQDALVELVIQDIKNILQVPATDYITLDASISDELFWENASQYPLDPESNRLTIVRNAEKIRSWDSLSEWLANSRSNPKNFIVFISNETDAPSIYSKGKRISYQDHIELIRTKGKFIKCSQPNDEDLVKWAASYGLTEKASTYLVERTSGDTETMLNVLRKVHIWDGSPSPKALSLLCDELALDSFADYLILRDKANAFLALKGMSVDEQLRAIGWLDRRLDSLMDIGRCVRRRMYDADISANTGIKVFLVKRMRPIVKDYDDRKIKYCRQLLAMADGAMRNGVKSGPMEVLISLW